MKLLSVGNDAKTVKGEKKGYLTGILYLLPTKSLCPACSPGCRKSCLVSAGHGQMHSVYDARAKKTQMYLHRFSIFRKFLIEDIRELMRKADKRGLIPCVRINGTSDIDIEKVFGDLLDMFSSVQFYDYTKVWGRVAQRENYHLTYSRSEKTPFEDIEDFVRAGKNVAVVFDKTPKTWKGLTVVSGDESDLRFLDPQGVIIGLKAKGKARKDTSGFVVKGE